MPDFAPEFFPPFFVKKPSTFVGVVFLGHNDEIREPRRFLYGFLETFVDCWDDVVKNAVSPEDGRRFLLLETQANSDVFVFAKLFSRVCEPPRFERDAAVFALFCLIL